MTTNERPTVCDCGHPPTPQAPDSCTTGYGTDEHGKTACFACCGLRDAEQMRTTGKHGGLYLVKRDGAWFVVNWPGTLELVPWRVRVSPRGGGFGSQRTDAWFNFEGETWHAVNRGDMDLCRCHRLKLRRKSAPHVRYYRGVRYVAKGRTAPASFLDPCTCGTCGRTWEDGRSTAITPTPAARCPFEHMHRTRAND
jgi:hypothetical protein